MSTYAPKHRRADLVHGFKGHEESRAACPEDFPRFSIDCQIKGCPSHRPAIYTLRSAQHRAA